MPVPERLTTTVSTKGQVILPKAIRRSLGWEAGTRRVVENTPGGVLPRPEPVFAKTRPEDVFGRLAGNGSPKSLAEMEAGIMAEARRRRHAGGCHQCRRQRAFASWRIVTRWEGGIHSIAYGRDHPGKRVVTSVLFHPDGCAGGAPQGVQCANRRCAGAVGMPRRFFQGSPVYQPANGSNPALGSQWQWPETPSARKVQGYAVGRKIQHQIGHFGIFGLEAVLKLPEGKRGGLR